MEWVNLTQMTIISTTVGKNPLPGHLPNPEIESGSPALTGGFFTVWTIREAPPQKGKYSFKQKAFNLFAGGQRSETTQILSFLDTGSCISLFSIRT